MTERNASSSSGSEATRLEKDTMGEMEVPADVLYGASTQRAVLNFPISGRIVPESVIRAFGTLKAACARVNTLLGFLDEARRDSIVNAAKLVADGSLPGGIERHFPVDIFQTGSGTSTNMNANEVIANLICQSHRIPIGTSKNADYIQGKGEFEGLHGVHPNDHVNMGQSSNDTFPTAMHIAAAVAIHEKLLPAAKRLGDALEAKAKEFDKVIKIGRTHLQDATPIRLGQEFSGYASQIRHAESRLKQALSALGELPIGGTAVGTGINTHREFGRRVAEDLASTTGIEFREAENHFEAQHAKDAVVEASGHLRTMAISLSKIANDIRWMGSGPRCGLGELIVPAVQPGSSIMPGKVNPVMCEAVIMVACQVIGGDQAIAAGAFGGVGSILDLNVAMPMMASNLMDSIHLLANASNVFVDNLLKDLKADESRAQELIERSLAMCTSLAPVIGYDKAAAIAKKAHEEGRTVREIATELKVLESGELDRLLDPWSMTEPS